MSAEAGPQSQSYTYDRCDLAALARLAKPRLVTFLMKLVWVLVGLAVLIIALAAYLGDPVETTWIAALALLFAMAVALDRLGPDLVGWLQIAVARRSGLLREQAARVTPHAFRAESSRGLTETKWHAVPRLQVEDGRLFVFIARQTAFVVPRRAFASDEEFEQFAAAARERWEQWHRL